MFSIVRQSRDIDFIHVHRQLCDTGVYQLHPAKFADVGFDHHGIHTSDFTADPHQFCNRST